MRAYAIREAWSDTVKVYVVEHFPSRCLVPTGRVGDNVHEVEWVPYAEGSEPRPLFQANTTVMEKVAEALVEFAPRLPATEDALQDTREIRDRLLTLVERRWES